MIRNFTADYIFPISSEPIKNGIVSIDESGTILGVYPQDHANLHRGTLERHSGIIVPGFINSHCHLELSHLLGSIPSGQGLVSFVKHVIETRKKQADPEVIREAMHRADTRIWLRDPVDRRRWSRDHAACSASGKRVRRASRARRRPR